MEELRKFCLFLAKYGRHSDRCLILILYVFFADISSANKNNFGISEWIYKKKTITNTLKMSLINDSTLAVRLKILKEFVCFYGKLQHF